MKYVTKYSEIEQNNSMQLRNLLRNWALHTLSIRNSMLRYDKSLNTPRIQFLYFHHVFKDEAERFNILLKMLSEYHEFISYSEAVRKILEKKIDKSYICISCDDGFKNNIYAAEILNRYGIKACFFINPNTIGLNDITKVKFFCKEKLHFPPVEFMDWKDIENLQNQGHEIGSHTMSHINIAETPILKVKTELVNTYDVLRTRCGVAKHFSFPYGRFFHFNKEAMKLVFETGFHSCASAERGCHFESMEKIQKDNLMIRRDQIIAKWPLDHIKHFLINNARKTHASIFESHKYSLW